MKKMITIFILTFGIFYSSFSQEFREIMSFDKTCKFPVLEYKK